MVNLRARKLNCVSQIYVLAITYQTIAWKEWTLSSHSDNNRLTTFFCMIVLSETQRYWKRKDLTCLSIMYSTLADLVACSSALSYWRGSVSSSERWLLSSLSFLLTWSLLSFFWITSWPYSIKHCGSCQNSYISRDLSSFSGLNTRHESYLMNEVIKSFQIVLNLFLQSSDFSCLFLVRTNIFWWVWDKLRLM